MKFYPKFLSKLVLPIAERVLNYQFISTLNFWKEIEKLDLEMIKSFQQKELEKLLFHAVKTVPGYSNLSATSRLTDFPIATKSMYRKNEDIWISTSFKKEDLLIEKSSGSSGLQGKVYMSRKESMRSLAHQTYMWSWAGYQPGERLLQLGMTLNRGVIKSLKDLLFRTIYTQAFNLNKEEVYKNLSKFRRKNGNIYFGGYASGLYEYARLGQENGINDIHFRSVISWGDKMFNHYRKTIESQFKTKVFDTYGCTEGLMIAGQCEFGSYHILSPHVFLEILDDQGKEVNVGEIGNVVVTRLDAYAMPLIRYSLGDLAIKEAEEIKCKCGKPFPLLRKIIGRDTDLVQTPSGKKLIVHFFTGIMEHKTEIIQFRVVQEDTQCFILEYIPERDDLNVDEILLQIKLEMEQKADEKLNIKFRKVPQILPTPSGKPQIIISNLK